MVRPRGQAFAALFLFWILTSSYAQIAPDIARGTSGDAVIRLYGWPRGKSVAGTRENWSYDGFQVNLEDGKVVSVAVSPSTAPRSKARPPLTAPGSRPLPAPRPATAPASSSSPATPIVSRPPTPPKPPPAVTSRPPPEPVIPKSAEHREPHPTAVSPYREAVLPFILLIVSFVAAVTAKLLVGRRARKPAPTFPAGGSEPPKSSFEHSIDQKLGRKVAAATSSPPPTAEELTVLTNSLLQRLEWKRVELLTSLYFNASGIRAECTGVGADGGVDVYLYRPGETAPYAYVQCKAHSADIGVALVRELRGAMAVQHITEGVFVTTSDYSPDARAFAATAGITLLNGRDLIARVNALPEGARLPLLRQLTDGDYTTPTCSSCDVKMVLRDGPRPFWGCPRYPRCQNTINLRASARNR